MFVFSPMDTRRGARIHGTRPSFPSFKVMSPELKVSSTKLKTPSPRQKSSLHSTTTLPRSKGFRPGAENITSRTECTLSRRENAPSESGATYPQTKILIWMRSHGGPFLSHLKLICQEWRVSTYIPCCYIDIHAPSKDLKMSTDVLGRCFNPFFP